MRNVRDRYNDDPVFRSLVDYMYILVETAQTTPTELREAAMLAQIIYEERHVRNVIVLERDLDNLDLLRRRE